MRKYFILLITFLMTFFSGMIAGAGSAKADRLYMKDGSLITGNIIALHQGTLSIVTEFAGDLDITQSAIKGIQTDTPMITQIKSGDRIAGALMFGDDAGQRVMSRQIGPVAVNVADIAAMWEREGLSPEVMVLREEKEEQAAKIKEIEKAHAEDVAALREKAESKAEDVWSGSVKFDFSGASGNTDETNLGGKAAAKRETEFDRLFLSLQGRFENDDGAETRNEITGMGKLERDITDRLFAFGSLELERDKFEEIDLRTNLTGGLGYFIIKEDTQELKPRLGVGYEVTAYENDPTEKDVVFSAGYDYRVDMLDKLRFAHSFTYLPAVENLADDYRLDSDASLAYPINEAKTWNVELGLQHQYDAMPAGDVKKLDTYYSLGLSRKFE